ncbi:hypothetical protein C6497_09075 [Candidatus Poribacteria bacterium]|nr:MAG: hypothetical protein C6497_09075 [Candidatus Poribacteria bacterium]
MKTNVVQIEMSSWSRPGDRSYRRVADENKCCANRKCHTGRDQKVAPTKELRDENKCCTNRNVLMVATGRSLLQKSCGMRINIVPIENV